MQFLFSFFHSPLQNSLPHEFLEYPIITDNCIVTVRRLVINQNPFQQNHVFYVTYAVVVNIDYYVAWGELEGYIRDEDGKKYILDGMLGMGEDKTLLL